MKTFICSLILAICCAVSVYADNDALLRAVDLERKVNAGKLTEAQFIQAIDDLLKVNNNSSDAVFIHALLHAASAQWVGQANNDITERYSVESLANAPRWLQFYAGATHEEQVVYDYIRHLAVENKLLVPDSLRSEVQLYVTRANRMGKTEISKSLADIYSKMLVAGDNAIVCRSYWLAARKQLRSAAVQRSGLGDTLLLYTRHAYHHKPNVCGAHVSWAYKPGGDLLAVTLRDGQAHPLVGGRLGAGHFHGADIWFDGSRVVFAYATQENWPPPAHLETVWPKPEPSNANFAHELREIFEPPHLYEINLVTGNISQLTDHNYWSDTEPAYLPCGSIVFASDRAGHSPSCDSWNNELTDLNLYTLNASRNTIHRLLNHKDIDTHPRLLNDGSIAYLRWEYQERHFMEVHSVWTTRPDGTGADALYKQHIPQPYSVRLATPLGKRSKRLLAVATGHHALPQGALVILDPAAGCNNPTGLQVVTQGMWINEGGVPGLTVSEGGRVEAGGFYTDPHAASEQSYLASYAFSSPCARRYTYAKADVDANGYGIYLIDVYGNKELLYRNPWLSAYNALPLRSRHIPPILADVSDNTKNYATCVVTDVYQGLDNVDRGAIRYIRISEALPWPVVPNEGVKRWVTGWTNDDKNATRWSPVRVIGVVPVEEDGSANFKVPISNNASVYFQALDENYMEIRRMRSSVSFAAGEVRSCTGCHETQSTAVATRKTPRALTRPVSEPVPPVWGADVAIHFPRDIQPIFDKHCISCHNGESPKAGLDFSKEKSFRTVRDNKLVVLSNHYMDGSITKVKQFGSHVSKLTQAIRSQEKMKVSLTDAEWQSLVTWVDANIPYSGEMYHLRTADSRTNIWAPYNWTPAWSQPKDNPALGERILKTGPIIVQK
ncbi:MAG: hypothetical protein LBS55_01845 [Prevotellaceae bacterium]|jgi:hypothetical protein|nr:hypothetical protein [Prevotellaceae bacterium]